MSTSQGTVGCLCNQGTLLHSVSTHQDTQVPPCRAALSQAGTILYSCTCCFLPGAGLGLFLTLLNLKCSSWPTPPAYTDPQEWQHNVIPLLVIVCKQSLKQLPYPFLTSPNRILHHECTVRQQTLLSQLGMQHLRTS